MVECLLTEHRPEAEPFWQNSFEEKNRKGHRFFMIFPICDIGANG